MLMKTLQGQTFVAHFPGAAAVYIVGRFDGFSVTTRPMQQREDDGLWEVTIPDEVPPTEVRYLVHWSDRLGGRLYRRDMDAIER